MSAVKTQINKKLFNMEITDIVDPYLIAPFNKKNNVFINVPDAQILMFKLFFTNIILKGKKDNILYLLSNKNNIILTFIHYVVVRKCDILAAKNENETLEIDSFIQHFKENKLKDFSFDLKNVYNSDENQLNNIKYKNMYKFEKFNRIQNEYLNRGWKTFNDTFLKFLITTQLNFCFDDAKCKSKDIMDEINLELLNVLCGLSLINGNLSGYAINSTTTKHAIFYGDRNRAQVRQKKVTMTTDKISSIFLIPSELRNTNNNDADAPNPIATMKKKKNKKKKKAYVPDLS